MGIVLKVTPEVLTNMANDIEQQIQNIENQFNLIEEEINQTRTYWEGDGSDIHKSQYDSKKDEIREAFSRLKNNPSNLLRMAGLYQETESSLEAVAQMLSADVII
jgi:WXG100 family type VII secretion target